MTQPLPAQIQQIIDLGIVIKTSAAPESWYKHIVNNQGKPDVKAINVYNYLVGWSLPTVTTDNQGKKVYKCRFAHDKLHITYAAIGEKFNMTKKEVKRACDFLKQIGLITTEQRKTWKTKTGNMMGNALFVVVVPEKLKEITYYPEDFKEKKTTTSYKKTSVTGSTSEVETNTIYLHKGDIYKDPQLSGCSAGAPRMEEKRKDQTTEPTARKEDSKKRALIDRLKKHFQWNRTLENKTSGCKFEVLEQAVQIFERKLRSGNGILGAGYFMGILKNLLSGIGSAMGVERLKRSEEVPYSSEEHSPSAKYYRCHFSGLVIPFKGKIDTLARQLQQEGFTKTSECSSWMDENDLSIETTRQKWENHTIGVEMFLEVTLKGKVMLAYSNRGYKKAPEPEYTVPKNSGWIDPEPELMPF